MSRYKRLNVHLGSEDEGQRREAALNRLAAEAGHRSVSAWLVALADGLSEPEAPLTVGQLVERLARFDAGGCVCIDGPGDELLFIAAVVSLRDGGREYPLLFLRTS